MLVLLPPSETKRDGGGESSALDLDALSFPALTPLRRSAQRALTTLSRSVGESNHALRLGPKQRFEIDRNRALLSSPTMPAIERYTGVLFDGLDAASLDSRARDWVEASVVIHSALFGLVRASDPIPAYRLSHDSRVPGLHLARHWRAAIAAELARADGVVLDLRSEAYEALGPAPERRGVHYLRVVSAASDGTKRALNHFNKKGKGELVRAMAQDAMTAGTLEELLAWAEGRGIRLEAKPTGRDPSGSGSAQGEWARELFLVV